MLLGGAIGGVAKGYRCLAEQSPALDQLGCDEDITPSDVPSDPPTVMQGPMTRARMRQLNLEVSLFLSDPFHTFENRLISNDVILERVKRN